MKINELEYLQAISEDNSIIGAILAKTSTSTYATTGFAYANGNAYASGQSTIADTKTSTTVISGIADFSRGIASADAYAQTGSTIASSSSYSQSVSVSD
jgi:hypothetical protein